MVRPRGPWTLRQEGEETVIQQPAPSGNQPTSRWTAGHTAVLNKEEKGLGGKEDPEPRGILHCQGVRGGEIAPREAASQGRVGRTPPEEVTLEGALLATDPTGPSVKLEGQGRGRCVESASAQIRRRAHGPQAQSSGTDGLTGRQGMVGAAL